jgi:hypothetical protein
MHAYWKHQIVVFNIFQIENMFVNINDHSLLTYTQLVMLSEPTYSETYKQTLVVVFAILP